MLRMIATLELGEIGISMPTEFGLQTSFGLVIGVHSHVFDYVEELAERRTRVEAQGRQNGNLLLVCKIGEPGIVGRQRDRVQIGNARSKRLRQGWIGHDGLIDQEGDAGIFRARSIGSRNDSFAHSLNRPEFFRLEESRFRWHRDLSRWARMQVPGLRFDFLRLLGCPAQNRKC